MLDVVDGELAVGFEEIQRLLSWQQAVWHESKCSRFPDFHFDCYSNSQSQLCNAEFSGHATEKNSLILLSASLTQFQVSQILSLFLVLLNSEAVFEQPKASTIFVIVPIFFNQSH